MYYTKPAIVSLGDALHAIQSCQPKCGAAGDSDRPTNTAYEADE
jgi:hypothetical protein